MHSPSQDEFRKQSERRQATVMFADISGFTSMSEKMDPEEVTSIINACFTMMGEVIAKNGGTIDKFIGDCIMVLFGAPIAVEDAPRRAINTAIEMRNHLYQFNQEKRFRIPLDIHIGINTGEVIAGEIGTPQRREYTVIGGSVNVAARLEEVSARGQILVGSSTFRLTREDFDYRELKPVLLKGKEAPVSVFELLSVKQRVFRSSRGAERLIHSDEIVGRGREIERLELQVMKVVIGEGSIVNLIGEAGIGKSRLVAELKTREVMKKVFLLTGRAISMGRNLAFYPIIDLLRSWVGITERDGEGKAFQRLEISIRDLLPQEADEVLPFVATLMGMRLSGPFAERLRDVDMEALEKLILKNVRSLLGKLSESTPLVILLEDLHWADMSSIGLMESLFRLAETHPILFLNVFRPGHEETGERIQSTAKERYSNRCIEIILQPLDERHCERLIHNLLRIRGLPHPIREQIVHRAGGNPLFIEEVVCSLIDEGAVVVKEGGFAVTEEIERVIIPQTIHGLLMARIDRLDESTRDLVKFASVIGRSFFYRILAEVARAVEDIDHRLEYLEGIQIIMERRRMEELEYLFKHALIQEVAYRTLLQQKRQELHLRVAESIENIFRPKLHQFFGMLAYHYSRGDDLNRAEEYMIKAGEEALKSSASSEVLHYYREALKLYLMKTGEAFDTEKIAMLQKNVALALLNKGQYVEAVEYFNKALSHYGSREGKGRLEVLLRFSFNLSSLLLNLYMPSLRRKRSATEWDEKIVYLLKKRNYCLAFTDPRRWFLENLNLAKRVSDLDLKGFKAGIPVFIWGSVALSWTGLSFGLSRKILEFIEKRIDPDDLQSTFTWDVSKMILDAMRGDWGERVYQEDLVNYNLRMGEINDAILYLIFYLGITIERGDFRCAEEVIKHFSEIAEAYDNDSARVYYHFFAARIRMKRFQLREALDGIESGLAILGKTGMHQERSFLWATRARIQVRLRNFQAAESSLLEAREHLSRLEATPWFSMYFWISQLIFDLDRMESCLASDERSHWAESRRRASAAIRRLRRRYAQKVAPEQTEAYRLMGTYYYLIGRQKKALRYWDRAIREGKRLRAQLELARTYREVGTRLLEPRSQYRELNGLGPQDFLDKAREIFEGLELKWDLRELEEERRDHPESFGSPSHPRA